MWKWIKHHILYISWTIALVATLGSFYLSNVLGWVPCVLCWYQRILMFPLVIIIGVGILRNSKDIEHYVLPMTIIGLGISFYHNLLQYHIISEAKASCTFGVPCVNNYHLFYNFLTVPLMSFIGFALITITMIIFNRTKRI